VIEPALGQDGAQQLPAGDPRPAALSPGCEFHQDRMR